MDNTKQIPPISVTSTKGINIAAVGCSHGMLDLIYKSVANIEKSRNIKIDLLLCNGDFEACRGPKDLDQLAGPTKYHYLKDFHMYHNGERTAPVLTVFIGGNHEGSNYLWELFYGGWVCPNIYYMGCAGVLNYGGLRIAGFSGVFKGYDFNKGHYEIPPLYDEGEKRSIYHVRAYELFKLSLMQSKIDIFMSHDWPHDVVRFGDVQKLIRQKPHFEDQIRDENLGCKEYTKLIKQHKPQYWVSGHMHVYFKAVIPHSETESTIFLALDKAEEKKPFIDSVSFPEAVGERVLTYDREWLAILRATHSLHGFTSSHVNLPNISQFRANKNVEKEMEWINANIKDDDLKVPYNFTSTYDSNKGMINPQSDQFIRLVGLSPTIYEQYKQVPASSSESKSEYKPRVYEGRGGGRGSGRGGGRGGRGRPYTPSYSNESEESSTRSTSTSYQQRGGGSFGGRGKPANFS